MIDLLSSVPSMTLVIAAALFGQPPAPAAVDTAPQRRPNLVVILLDDVGYADLGCYGARGFATPNIDAMAAAGVRLTDFYVHPVCGVTRAALMTGCYAMRVAEVGNRKHGHPILHGDEVTVAEVLRGAGYATGLIGKWHLGGPRQDVYPAARMPSAHGFDYHFGTPVHNGLTRDIDGHRFRTQLVRNGEVLDDALDQAEMDQLTRRYTEEATAFIRSSRAQPFFLLLAHNMAHVVLGASDEFRGSSKRSLYGDAMQELDWSTGRVLAALREHGLADDTLVLLTSDNGPWVEPHLAGETPADDHYGRATPLRGHKMTTWEGGVRVPCIAWGPGRVAPGKTCREPATIMDLLPTLAALAGAATPADRVIDGKDLRPLLFGAEGARSPHAAIYHFALTHLQAVRAGQWKLVRARPARPRWTGWSARMIDAVARPQLFDLANDIGEQRDVAAEHPDVVARLTGLIERGRADLGDYDRIGAGQRFFDAGPKRPGARVWIERAARSGPAITHAFLACGARTFIRDGAGEIVWRYPHSTRDGYVLPGGDIVLVLTRSKRHPGGAVVRVTRAGAETMLWRGRQSEVNSVQPVGDDRYVITEAGPKPRLLEIDGRGAVHVEFALACQLKNHHMQTRMARKLDDGTYLVPHLLDFAVKQYDAAGKVLAVLDTTAPGDPERRQHTWPFTAIRLPDGRTHVNCTHGNRALQFDRGGRVVWQIDNGDLPGPWIDDACGGQVLPNGNVVLTAYRRTDPALPKLIEITPDKRVVWTYRDDSDKGIHHFQILDTDGEPLAGPPRK